MKCALLIICLLCIVPGAFIQAQEKKELSYYAFDSAWNPTTNVAEAAYLMQLTRESDTAFICRYYTANNAMLRQEAYADAALSIPNGRFCWYDANGNLDSTGIFEQGKKDLNWYYYNDSLKTTISFYYNMGQLQETRDYVHNIFTDSIGNQTNLKEKDSIARLQYKADSASGKLLQKEAMYKGDISNWTKYISKNMETPKRLMNLKEDGLYGINVTFTIDKKGHTTDIYLMHSCELSADNEVCRVIAESPVWQPATKNGATVFFRQRQWLYFQVSK
ncbi:hypothetical protein [Limnovirga soli]|uniref:TonB C-terminal domain-containing protein n=1 Tax=Limnovirga soli TaxID=2656915 RepID=A0A8J8JV96_9BACT|nr:hypothetical protein [Limnovirga soli]NNV57155.1 hypothetical protein [Limnovirga soli]